MRITSLLLLALGLCLPVLALSSRRADDDALAAALKDHQYDLEQTGLAFLTAEADQNGFFLLGELHGENEIPALLGRLWPQLWNRGYRHIAAEVSPWAAHQLEFVPDGQGPAIVTLWTKQEATIVHSMAGCDNQVLWGCDMEEVQPQFLIRDLLKLNPADPNLLQMDSLVKHGYERKLAAALSDLLRARSGGAGLKDVSPNGISLLQNLTATLLIEKDRLDPGTRMSAQNRRELLMKQQFLEHYRAPIPGKVFLRFGRNHLHRGYDARGISTLGNFVAEFATAQGMTAFNVGAFGAGGQIKFAGKLESADERADEPAFAWLAEQARFSATVFDLRPLRPVLHAIPSEKRSPLETNLIYWADAYDSMICYKHVTPLNSK